MEAALTALLASIAGGRRYWTRAPQDAPRPFAVMTRISGERDYHYKGASGYIASRVQIDVYADHWTTAKATAAAVISTLSGYRSSTIQAIFIDSQRDLPATDAGEAAHLFRSSVDIIIHHTET